MRKNLLIFALLGIASTAYAESWKDALSLPGLEISIDQDSVSNVDGIHSAWQKWVYSQDQSFQGKTYRSGKYFIYTDCARNTRANAQIVLLDHADNIIFEKKSPMFAFAPLLPGSIPEKVQRYICKS